MFDNEVEVQDTNAEYSDDSYEDLFIDSKDDETPDTNEESEAEEETEEEEPEENPAEETPEPEQTFDYKYLGKTTQLPQKEVSVIAEKLGVKPEDVIAQLQKGANYDESPTKRIIHRLAKANGMEDEAYMKFLGQSAETLEDKQFRDKIAEEHPDWDDEKIEMRVKLDKIEAGKKAEQEAQQAKMDENQPFIDFLNKYPDFDVQKGFPKEVAADIQKGIHPIIAYESYVQKQKYEQEYQNKLKELNQQKKRQDNNNRSVGSLKDAGGDYEKDDFLAGLLGR